MSEPDVVCAIVAGELATEVVYSDDQLIAFLDHRPLFKGHVLVCPVRHVGTLPELPAELIDPLFRLVQRISTAVVDGLGADGSFTAINTVISQSVPHLHVHVVPRSKGDGLRGFFWPRTRYAEGEAAEYAARLRAALL
ncbi:MAG: HIT family protein [Propionibacteriaceae bacterium]|nr:HIT family protein [Propionibacteriaceae bacterium]